MRTPTLQYLYLQKPLMFLLLITVISICWIYADFTPYLPSVIAFVGLIGACFLFFGRRVKSIEAFLTCLLLITSLELHRTAMTAESDMIFTALIALTLFCLFRWEEDKKLKGFPIAAIIAISCTVLTKGFVGIVLPLFVFGVYLLILKYNFWKIAGKYILIALASMILPAIGYYLIHKQGVTNIFCELGQEQQPYSFISLITGFIPWTLLLLMSLFVIKYSFKFSGFKKIWSNVLSMNKVKLFSLVAVVLIVFFSCIPLGNNKSILMSAYPFIAVFMAQYILYLVEYKSKTIRAFSLIIGSIGVLVALIFLLTILTQLVEPTQLFGFIKNETILSETIVIWSSLNMPNFLNGILFAILLFSIYILFNLQRKKNNLKILYATVGAYLAILLILNGIFIPAF